MDVNLYMLTCSHIEEEIEEVNEQVEEVLYKMKRKEDLIIFRDSVRRMESVMQH
jgi:hypothetical protein